MPTQLLVIGLAAGAGATVLAAGTLYWGARPVRRRARVARVGVLIAVILALLNVGMESA